MSAPAIDFDPRVDYYARLGVAPTATDEEIKKAYRRLAKEHHPDATGGDKRKESRFKEVSAAYEVLRDKGKRAQYDALRVGGGSAPGGGFATEFPGGFDLRDLFGGVGAAPDGAHYQVFTSGFDLGDLFGAPRRKPRPRKHHERKIRAADGSTLTVRGNDVYSDLRIELDQAVLGTVKKMATVEGTATVKVPPGTSSGKRLRLRGKGARGADGTRGDHYLTVHIDIPGPDKLDEPAKRALAEFMKQVRRR